MPVRYQTPPTLKFSFMKTLIAFWLTLIFLLGSIVVIPTANAWILPFLFRAAVMNVAKQELRTRRAKCKQQLKDCSIKTKSLAKVKLKCGKSRLKKACQRFKFNRQEIIRNSQRQVVIRNGGF